jgi:hypothetical protein
LTSDYLPFFLRRGVLSFWTFINYLVWTANANANANC